MSANAAAVIRHATALDSLQIGVPQKIRWFHRQCMRNSNYIEQAYITLPSLYLSHVAAIDLG